MVNLTFYTKLGCHLCSEAYQILLDIAWEIPLEIDVIDIMHTHNKDIAAAYFYRIPVVARPDIQTELEWPFTHDDVRAYLAH